MDGFFPKHWKAGALQLLNNSFIKYRLATNYESPFVALISFFSTQLLPAPHRPAPVLCSAGASSTPSLLTLGALDVKTRGHDTPWIMVIETFRNLNSACLRR